jgi:hypothetical protein
MLHIHSSVTDACIFLKGDIVEKHKCSKQVWKGDNGILKNVIFFTQAF